MASNLLGKVASRRGLVTLPGLAIWGFSASTNFFQLTTGEVVIARSVLTIMKLLGRQSHAPAISATSPQHVG